MKKPIILNGRSPGHKNSTFLSLKLDARACPKSQKTITKTRKAEITKSATKYGG